MDTTKYMIILKGKIKTYEIKSYNYNNVTRKIDVEFNDGSLYSYAYSNAEFLKEPQVLDPKMYQISKGNHVFFGVKAIYVFKGVQNTYWHICFTNGVEKSYQKNELEIVESCLKQEQSSNVFRYLKRIANLSKLENGKTGEKLLAKKFAKMTFVGENVALAKYLNPSLLQQCQIIHGYIPIFPFGCNNSQYKAVKNTMENQISVIQGPPGTGKTQTILNIIANILMKGETVQIVSNNNSAIENVYEKLSSSKYNLGFIVAMLGSSENKSIFVEQQDSHYPDFSSWKLDGNRNIFINKIYEKSIQLKNIFDMQEKLAILKQEYSQLVTELEYFNRYAQISNIDTNNIKIKKKITASRWMSLWQEYQMIAEEKQKIGFLFKIKAFLQYGISNLNFYKQDIIKIITIFQTLYYQAKKAELEKEIEDIEIYLQNTDKDLLNDLCNQSMAILKNEIAKKYDGCKERKIFNEDDLWKNSKSVLKEYPVILSTTFSSRNSLNESTIYDYLIMDEASQVDIATGALALSCAKNVVIVGDTKQLPNVVKKEDKKKVKEIFDSFNIHEGYQFTRSFLQSVLDIMPNVTQALLREHYRCHPKIINFCNQKFYRGELIIMTEDKGEKDVLFALKTVPGNHARDHYSQRQIDVIKNEIQPKFVINPEKTGIIAPYRKQVEALEKEFNDVGAATVHKFQGKEKDTIIISTVDDQISDFADDPYLINVAVSRAKKRLMLVVTGNKQIRERNIIDLVDYIQYNNFEVVESKVHSVFDYLYKQYTEERKKYLLKHKKISQYDSENLMYALIKELLLADKYACLDVVCHFPLRMLIKNCESLNDREIQYVKHPNTHIDFLLFNRISKKAVLAIEVDGYKYHKEGTVQASRDSLKNHILELYQIPLLRFMTNGSGEKERLGEMLDKLVG